MFTPEDGEKEPDWVVTERKHFTEFRDVNKVKQKQKKSYPRVISSTITNILLFATVICYVEDEDAWNSSISWPLNDFCSFSHAQMTNTLETINIQAGLVSLSLSAPSVSIQNGYLEADEVGQWVLPTEVDHADNEAKHLIHETDTNKVGVRALLSCTGSDVWWIR